MFRNRACIRVMPPYIPVAVCAVIRLPADFIPKIWAPSVSTTLLYHDTSAAVRYPHLPDTYQTRFFRVLYSLAHHHAFWTQRRWAV